MNISEQDVRRIVREGESEQIEFKTSLRDASTLVQNITAFSNAHGGTIVVGVQEPHNIVGADPEQIIRIVERARPMFVPAIDFGVSTIEIDNKQVVAITIPESREIVFGNGMALKRVGGQNLPLSPQEIVSKLSAPAETNQIGKIADAISKQTETIEKQTQTIDQQTKTIEALKDDLQKAGSLPSKLKEWLIGGVIGAILGGIVTIVLGG